MASVSRRRSGHCSAIAINLPFSNADVAACKRRLCIPLRCQVMWYDGRVFRCAAMGWQVVRRGAQHVELLVVDLVGLDVVEAPWSGI